jgi:hypothetical protein
VLTKMENVQVTNEKRPLVSVLPPSSLFVYSFSLLLLLHALPC